MMFYILGTIAGILIVIEGVFLVIRRKHMIWQGYEMLFGLFVATLKPAIDLVEIGYGLQLLFIGVLPLSILIIVISNGIYTLTNVNSEIVLSAITDILKEKDVPYEEEGGTITLKEYKNVRISYRKSLDSVIIDLDHISNLYFYQDFKKELRYRVKENRSKLFPSSGLFSILIGIIFIVVVQYL